METESKPRKIRIISGAPALVDAQVNEMLDQYTIQAVNYATCGDRVIVTCFLVHNSEMRKAALMQPMGTNQRRAS